MKNLRDPIRSQPFPPLPPPLPADLKNKTSLKKKLILLSKKGSFDKKLPLAKILLPLRLTMQMIFLSLPLKSQRILTKKTLICGLILITQIFRWIDLGLNDVE